jgi:hypothetical protein
VPSSSLEVEEVAEHVKLTVEEWQMIVKALDAHAAGMVGVLAEGPWGEEAGREIEAEIDLAGRLRTLFDPSDGAKPQIIVTVRA